MEKPKKLPLPAPNFSKNEVSKQQLHFLTPSGMSLLSRERPPPMYGPKKIVSTKLLETEDKKPIEESAQRQFCEACEMELQSIEHFRRHRSQHERCPVDGCKYKGHPTVMDKHVVEMHNSGVFDKIKKLCTPEEIAAWREERRKKYPTLANAKMRQLAEEQKQRRGERIHENKARFGRPEDRKRARTGNKTEDQRNYKQTIEAKRFRNNENNNRNRKDGRINERILRKPEEKLKTMTGTEKSDKVKSKNIDDISCGVKMFGGTSKIQGYKHEKPKQKKEQHALLSLVGMYGSDDSESMSENEEMEHENNLREIQIPIEDTKETSCEKTKEDENQCDEESKISSWGTGTLNQTDTEKTKSSENDKITHCDSEPQSIVNSGTMVNEKILDIQVSVEDLQENTKSLHESSDEGPEEAPIQRKTTIENIDFTKPKASDLYSNTLEPESLEAKRLRIQQSRKQIQEQRKSALNIRNKKLRRQNTMLEKLLEPEIRHERNMLLQCVRFVCENNFFGIQSESGSKE